MTSIGRRTENVGSERRVGSRVELAVRLLLKGLEEVRKRL